MASLGRTITGNSAARLELVERHGITPYAPRIEPDGFWVIRDSFERGPMTKNNGLALCQAPLVTEPGGHFFTREGIRYGRWAFADEVELALAGAVAHAGQVVGDDSEPGHTAQAVIPNNGFIAVHLSKKVVAGSTLKHNLDFFGAPQSVLYCPYGRDPSVHHGDAGLVVSKRLEMQPFNQLFFV